MSFDSAKTAVTDTTEIAGSSNPGNKKANGTKLLLLGLTAAAVSLSLTGCFNGMNAGTQQVGASGDGVNGTIGDGTIQLRNMVWVRDKTNPKNLTLSGAFNNISNKADTLTEVTTNPPSTVTITGGSITIDGVTDATDQSVRVGYNADKYIDANNINVAPSAYVATTFKFKNAGTDTLSILVVAPEGDYANVKSK